MVTTAATITIHAYIVLTGLACTAFVLTALRDHRREDAVRPATAAPVLRKAA